MLCVQPPHTVALLRCLLKQHSHGQDTCAAVVVRGCDDECQAVGHHKGLICRNRWGSRRDAALLEANMSHSLVHSCLGKKREKKGLLRPWAWVEEQLWFASRIPCPRPHQRTVIGGPFPRQAAWVDALATCPGTTSRLTLEKSEKRTLQGSNPRPGSQEPYDS